MMDRVLLNKIRKFGGKVGERELLFPRRVIPIRESSFGRLSDKVNIKKPMVVSKPISYVFYMNLPLVNPSDDYTTAFHHLSL